MGPNRGTRSDATRMVVAVLAGAAAALAIAYPVFSLPTPPPSLGADTGATGAALIAGALAILVVPLGTFALYQMLALSEG